MTTQRELATAERELFEAASAQERAGRSCGQFAAALGGESLRATESRAYLLNAGVDADVLWVEVDERGMTLATAVRLLRTSRKTRKPIAETLAAYLSLGRVRRTADGREYRVRSANEPLPTSTPAPSPPVDESDPLERARTAIRAWIAVTIPEGDGELDAVSSAVWAEVQAVLSRTAGRLRKIRLRAEGHDVRGPTRAELREACAILGLDPPRAGQGFDMAIARRAQRRMLAAAHPDTTGTNNVDAYHRINAAFAVVTAYQETLATTPLNGKKERRATDDERQGPEDDAHHEAP